ncbi:ATP-dependent DNA helicase RecQ [Lewinella marina]|uniref:ATP-dependent DNA helicase RecQ n=1 Tax=Neolewinella marina TaxID=438751 RepID=A0A2G0CHY4_9BACT|nr:ATP-dependent DNA helicase RecQ [Neolewinella marina]NJB85287.1 ATP-dependent DNA helicase RecQ [Neolewinella marina]PHK99592.1 recombinase RecQ [Neolewinella marina]
MPTPTDILQQYWGYPAFRPLQADIIDSVLQGQDTLALLPTGGGKSICFQVPGLMLEGVTLVVSPLIALMKDQVRQLRKRGIVADAVYSGMRNADIDRVLDNAVYGNTKFLYLSPERLLTDLARERIRRMPLALVAVDEAHCISQWGYDFRPPYLRIAELRELHPTVPFIAVTATATPTVVEDIQEKLEFRARRDLFQQSFSRENLAYVVRRPASKEQQLLEVLNGVKGTAIVYVRSRGLTKEIAHKLTRRGIPAAAYHAGLEGEEKDKRQEAWLEGRLRVMVATNAFGMGIDKPDVRTVIHYGPPDSPEAYFQEAGRGGRDGKPAYGVMLYHSSDGERLIQHWEASYPPIPEIKRLYRALGSYLQLAVGGGKGEVYDFDLGSFGKRFGFDVRQAYSGLKALEQAGYVMLTDDIEQPAQLQFLIGKERLYDYQIKHPQTNKLVKSILRTTQGAFLNPVQLREGALANFLKISLEELRRTFLKMKGEGIIDYTPERSGPQLVFVEERIDPDNLRIDERQYRFLRDRARHRIDTMIGYCERDDQCRSQRLLHYFGESEAPECGLCDVCRRRKIPPPDCRQVLSRVTELLTARGNLSVPELLKAFPTLAQPEISGILQDLINEGLLVKQADSLRLP